jgi:hypothetical protein
VDEVVMAEEDKQMPPTMKRHQTGGTGFRKFDQHSGKWV